MSAWHPTQKLSQFCACQVRAEVVQNPDQPVQPPKTLELGWADRQTADRIRARICEGWRCVRFEFCVSFLFATVRRQSAVYLTGSWQRRCFIGMGYSALALFLGPWGMPWGPFWAVQAIWSNLTGGIDVTDTVLELLNEPGPTADRPFQDLGIPTTSTL